MMFSSPDTLIPDQYNPLDWNRYSYVRNNPIRYSDPTGHMVDDGCRTEGCSANQGLEYHDYVYNVVHNNNERLAHSKTVSTVLVGITELELGPFAILFKAINDEQIQWYDAAFLFAGFHDFGIPTGLLEEGGALSRAGSWVQRTVSMSEEAKAYQSFVTGVEPGWEFLRNGVHFDGARITETGQMILLDAKKAGMGSIYEKVSQSWAQARILSEAQNQIRAAGNLAVEWHVSSNEAFSALSNFFADMGIGISVKYTPWP